MLKRFAKVVMGERAWAFFRKIKYSPIKSAKPYFDYDLMRFVRYAGPFHEDTIDNLRARIIVTYHVIEKGLTMPSRRYGFGKEVIRRLIGLITEFQQKYGFNDEQVLHATGVVAAYYRLHNDAQYCEKDGDKDFWVVVKSFLDGHADVLPSIQPHISRESFYSNKNASFPAFAQSRHTVRHYAQCQLPVSRIEAAVTLALSAPSACNRQYCRVHLVSGREKIDAILKLQGGSRGFGHLADKLLIVTSDLEGIVEVRERDDLFTNGGMFLMNLCYGLFYNEIAHCVLNWSRSPDEDLKVRELTDLKPSETIIAVLTCGETPDEFDVAASPRKKLSDVLIKDRDLS